MTAVSSEAGDQLSVTLPPCVVAWRLPGAVGLLGSRTRTTIPLELDDTAVIDSFETGSVIVLPTASGASDRDEVPGVESSRSVALGDVVGLAVPRPIRTVTPVTAGDEAPNVSNAPNGVRTSRSKKLPSPRGTRTSLRPAPPKYGVRV